MLPRVAERTPEGSCTYPGEYVQLPWGVRSTTLGSLFNYPRKYVQLPLGVCSITMGSMFNYHREYVQLPWGVCSTTLGSMFQLPGGVKSQTSLKTKKNVQCCLEKIKNTSRESVLRPRNCQRIAYERRKWAF